MSYESMNDAAPKFKTSKKLYDEFRSKNGCSI